MGIGMGSQNLTYDNSVDSQQLFKLDNLYINN